jgi:hypothetical protein
MVRTQDLLQHIIKVSHGQGTQDQDIKYEHMVRELGNISKTVLQHSGDPGLRLSPCLPWPRVASLFLPALAAPTCRLLSVYILPRRYRMQLPLPCFLCLSTGSCVCMCVAARVGCRCETGVEVGRIGEKMTRNEYFVFAAGLDCLSFWCCFVLIATRHVLPHASCCPCMAAS